MLAGLCLTVVQGFTLTHLLSGCTSAQTSFLRAVHLKGALPRLGLRGLGGRATKKLSYLEPKSRGEKTGETLRTLRCTKQVSLSLHSPTLRLHESPPLQRSRDRIGPRLKASKEGGSVGTPPFFSQASASAYPGPKRSSGGHAYGGMRSTLSTLAIACATPFAESRASQMYS